MSTTAPLHQRVVDADHPWLGLESFTEATQRYFYGRDAEIADIFVRTRENSLTVLYGQSGLGKTSLLGAGLIPKLKIEGYRPVLIRLRYEKTDSPLVDQVKGALTAGPAGFSGDTLWEILHHIDRRDPALAELPPVLIFDQFEEAFTLGQRAERLEEVRALFTEMADVIENRPPAALKQRFLEDRKLARDYDLTPTPLRIVITLREDYLSHLEQWKRLLPSLMANRMALHLLSGPQALDAVVKPGRMEGRRLVDEEVGARIVRFVANRGPEVPLAEIGAVPPLLSLVCDELNTQRIEQKRAIISAERVTTGVAGAATDDDLEARSRVILQAFYKRSFAGFPAGVQAFIEDRMVTTAGHRCPVSRDDAVAALARCRVGDPAAAMQELVNRRLISTEERGGVQWFEITHDVLVPIVRDSRDKRLARLRLRRAIMASLGLLAVLAVFGGITVWALAQQREAVVQRDEAQYQVGLGWMLRAQVAEERNNRYPDTLLHAAQAIGFDSFGRPGDADLLRFIRKDRNPADYEAARKWIADRAAYVPIWVSAARSSAPSGLSVSPEGRRLALSAADGSVRLWDFRDAKESVVLPPGGGPVADVSFHPSGDILAIATGDEVRLWDLEKAAFTSTLPVRAARLAWSPGGEILAAAAADGPIALLRDGKVTSLSTGFDAPAATLAFCPDNSALVAAYPGGGMRVVFPHAAATAATWDQLDAKNAESLDEEKRPAFLALAEQFRKACSAALRPDGQVVAVGDADGAVNLWDAGSATPIGQSSLDQRHAGAVRSICYRPDGREIATGSEDGTIRLWAIHDRTPVVTATLTGHSGAVTSLAYVPGGGLLASAGADGTARLWNVSGAKAATPDLFAYLNWYRFAPAESNALAWNGGAGFANVPPDSITGVWQGGGDAAFVRLLAAKDWPGAAAVLPPGGGKEQLATELLADAKEAAKASRWNRVDLRLGQLKTLGAAVDTTALTEQRQAFAPEAKPFTTPDGISFLWCPPSAFTMGSPETEAGRYGDETPHKVTLKQGFWLSQYELTQAQWTAVMGSNPSTQKTSGPKAPVENISWTETVDFCRRLTDRERARGTIPPGWEYALPSEAQWEYACRAGTSTAYSFGDDPSQLYRYGNFNDKTGNFLNNDATQDDESQYTAPVGKYLPNAWNFHDMHGNVWEWCMDSIDPANSVLTPVEASDPLGVAGTHRVNRGGGFFYSARNCRSASRDAIPPSSRDYNLGFRPALVPCRPVRIEEGSQSQR